MKEKTYFVYLILINDEESKEELFAKDLTHEQAMEQWEYADRLMEGREYEQYPCRSACIGSLSNDVYVAQRLGLIK
jgi:hypothetical protein